MRGALDAALSELAADDEVRVAVLTGAGTAFCAGADLSDAPPPTRGTRWRSPAARSRSRWPTFPKPLIAAINGPAFGGGLELALACDLRVAAAGATFALPEVRIGSLPGSGGTQRLVRAVGPAVAARMLLSGEPLSAEDALRNGLISDLVEPGELIAFTARPGPARSAATRRCRCCAAKRCLAAAGRGPAGGRART